MAKNDKKPVNPMKDGPEDEEKVVFESEELATYAAEAAKEYDIDLGEIKGSGADGVITADDVDQAIKEATEIEVDFASPEAGEFYAENEDDINLDEVEGTGKDGAITVEDMEKLLTPAPAEGEEIKFTTDAVKEAAEKDHGVDLKTIKGTAKDGSINAKDIRSAVEAIEAANAPANPPAKDPAEEEAGEGVETVDEIKAIIDDLVSFGLPVRGTLKNKPKVLERWNDLQARAVKAQRAF